MTHYLGLAFLAAAIVLMLIGGANFGDMVVR